MGWRSYSTYDAKAEEITRWLRRKKCETSLMTFKDVGIDECTVLLIVSKAVQGYANIGSRLALESSTEGKRQRVKELPFPSQNMTQFHLFPIRIKFIPSLVEKTAFC